MIVREERPRPRPWPEVRAGRPRWMLPLLRFELFWQWVAYFLSRWTFLEVLEYLGNFSVLVGVIFYFSESGDRIKVRHYQAWQVINSAQGKGGSGGRIDALQELNADHVPFVGVDLSSAFLQGLQLSHANLLRADLSSADLRNCNFRSANLQYANLESANFRGSDMTRADLEQADLRGADLVGSDLSAAKLAGAVLDNVDLRRTHLQGIDWTRIRSIKMANVADVRDAPSGFVAWALSHGALQNESGSE